MPSFSSITALARVTEIARAALLRRRRLLPVERMTAAQVASIQRERLAGILAHAALHSRFYRRRFAGVTPTVADLPKLEPVTKEEILGAAFDEAVTVPGLTKSRARELLGSPGRHPFVVATTSGSSGEPALYPFSRAEWVEGMAHQVRAAGLLKPRDWSWAKALRKRPRTALVFTHHPIHISSQVRNSYTVGLARTLSLSAGSPVGEQIVALAAFQPGILGGYPSALGLLARAQLEGRLAIRPFLVVVGGETLTPPSRARLREAFGVEPYDIYGLTETLVVGVECAAHNGMHVFEDAVLVEVVDQHGRVLPPGERGAAVLFTNLFNRTLPLIRYAVSDLVTLTDEPCACGLPFRRILAVDGRREEIITLRNRTGAPVDVHPFAIESPLEERTDVRRFQIRVEETHVRVLVVLETRTTELAEQVGAAIHAALAPYDLAPGQVLVEVTDAVAPEHGPTDKQRRVLGPQ